jgi:hypothetical protein
MKHGYALFFSLALTALTGFVLLDTFVLPHAVTTVVTTATASGRKRKRPKPNADEREHDRYGGQYDEQHRADRGAE